jgi:hypothetical protein
MSVSWPRAALAEVGARAQRRRDPVARRLRRVGRRHVDLTDTTRREDHRPGADRADAVPAARAPHVQRDAAHRPSLALPRRRGDRTGAREEVDDEGVLDDLDAGIVAHRLELCDEGAGDLRTGRVPAGVRDPVGMVTALAREGHLSAELRVEPRPARDELADPRRPLGDEHLDGSPVAEPAPGDEGVLEVGGRRVGRVERCRDPALGPDGRPRGELALRHEEHPRDAAAELERGGEPGDARADDDDVRLGDPPGLRGGERRRETRPLAVANPGERAVGCRPRRDDLREAHAPVPSGSWKGAMSSPLASSP